MDHLHHHHHLQLWHRSTAAARRLLVVFVLATVTTAQFVPNAAARQPTAPFGVLHQASDSRAHNRRQFEVLPESAGKTATGNNEQSSSSSAAAQEQQKQQQQQHSRSKRMIWITDDGRLALPPGTVLSISPTISLPLVRYPPTGFLSNMTMSFPLTIDFDKLGLTDNENPLGVLPPVFGRSMGRSMGRAAGSLLSNYVGQYLNIRKKRETIATGSEDRHRHQSDDDDATEEQPDALPEQHQHEFHGGERAILYGVMEDMIATFGLNGKACMLRAICETHSKAVHQYGLFGEMAKLFFTASKSKYSDMLPEYVLAEKVGEGSSGPGECFPYYKDCPRSIFRTNTSKRYSDDKHSSTAGVDDRRPDVDGEHLVQLRDNEINDINGMDEQSFNM